MKIKVLHIIKSLGRGGAEMLLPETLKVHNKHAFEFHYIYFLPWKDDLVSRIQEEGGRVTCIPAKNNIQLLLNYPKVISYCKEQNIDIMHSHLPWAGFVSRLVFKKLKIPLFYTEHNLQERYHPITKLLNKWTYNWQSLGIGVSEDVALSIKKNINPTSKVITILNGVNTNTFQPHLEDRKRIRDQYNIPEDAIVVGLTAVFRFQKRIDIWLEVISHSIKKNKKIYGLIVGTGPLEEEIKEVYEQLQLKNRVFFAGLQTNVKPFYAAMDVFMMTSSFEGLPIALLEAMSMECAIATTDAGGIKEAIRHKKDGYVVEVNQWEKLSNYILDFQESPKKRSNYAKKARQRVESSFSLQQMIQKLERLYIQYTHAN